MSTRFFAAVLLALPVLLPFAACGGSVVTGGAACPEDQVPACNPSGCDGEFELTGVASCVEGKWVCQLQSCSGGASDGSACTSNALLASCQNGKVTNWCCPAGASCPRPPAYCDHGDGTCSDGACPCNGTTMPYCDSDGHIAQSCCPAGANCDPTQAYCDLGNGNCTLPGANGCLTEDDAGTCTKSIYAESYDQSCTTDADCSAVYSGDLCGMCECPNDALNKNVASQYQAALAAMHPKPNVCDCASIPTPSCVAGKCGLFFPD